MPPPPLNRQLSLFDRLRILPVVLTVAVLCVMVAGAAALVLSEISSRRAIEQAARITQFLDRGEAIAEFNHLMVEAESGRRGFLLSQNVAYLQPVEAAAKRFDGIFERMRLRVAGEARSLQIKALHTTALEQLESINNSISIAQATSFDDGIAAFQTASSKRKMDDFERQITAVRIQNSAELSGLRGTHGRETFWPRVATAMLTVLVFGLLIAVMRLLLREASWQQAFAKNNEDDARHLQELVAVRTAELSDIATHVQTSSEREKAEIARNLHGELGGLLTAARMDVSWLQSATVDGDTKFTARLADLNKVFTEAIEVKRRAVEVLRPALLDHFGLPIALQNHFDETCRKAGLNCQTTIPEEMVALPTDLAIALFRVGQLSLANILRYAKASNVELSIRLVGGLIEVVVQDDGVGIDLNSREEIRAHGIAGMRLRLQALKGSFDISPRRTGGTEIRMLVPMSSPIALDPPIDSDGR